MTEEELQSAHNDQKAKQDSLIQDLRLDFERIGTETKDMGTKIESRFQQLNEELTAWTTNFNNELGEHLKSGGESGAFGSPSGRGSQRPDKKELAVWTCPDNISKQDFRHRVAAIENNLEGVHGYDQPDAVFDAVTRQQTEITEETLIACIRKASDVLVEQGQNRIDSSQWSTW